VSDSNPPGPGEFAAGSTLAGYRLDEIIGRGGMAVVYRAFDGRLQRRVALKVLAPELVRDEEFRLRFIRESRAAAAVDHPNILPIFEAGEADRVLFIAMRYVQGGDVRNLIDGSGRLPAARACAIVAQVASALDMAHAHGLVHRDVKPANMLREETSYAGQPDHVYLSDFGLSKRSAGSGDLTSRGHFLGTLNYVAPEQIEGRNVDGRADLYALACSAFEMLSGDPPFRRDDNMAVMWAQVNAPPPPLAGRATGLPKAVDGVMGRALAKQAGGRYVTCLEFASALADACGLHPAEPRLASPPARGGGLSQLGLGGRGQSRRHPPAGRPPAGPPPAGQRPASPASGGRAPGGPGGQQAPPGAAPSGPGQTSPVRRPGPAAGDPDKTDPGVAAPASRAGQAGPPRDRPRTEKVAPAAPRRPWVARRTGASVIAACVVVLGTVGGFLLLSNPSHGHAGASAHGTPTPGAPTTPARARRVIAVPGCTTKTAPAKTLAGVPSHTVEVGQVPFDVVPDGRFGFVSDGTGITVLDTAGPAPRVLRSVPLQQAQGEALTPDGHLLVATGSGMTVFQAKALEQGPAEPVGSLTVPGGIHAVEVAVSRDGSFAFVSLQNSSQVAVFDLRRALSVGFGPADVVGTIHMPGDPVGLSVSPDGRYLYVASGLQRPATTSGKGYLSVVSVAKAESSPGSSILKNIGAGCGPDRMAVSPGGRYLWLTAGGGNALLAYTTSNLLTDPRHALVAKLPVGELPLGMAFIHNGSTLVVADSNRDQLSNATSNLAVVDVRKALAGERGALLGFIRSGQTPRQFAVTRSGALLVTNTESSQVQAVNIAHLP
jgi:DNA-binding beta-propeller fold protein YncE/tRNA A-37 threonylcarbamoyl transferase component Bud32